MRSIRSHISLFRLGFTPTLRWYVQICSRIIMSKSLENTSKYVDTVTFFKNLNEKGHWPLDDLWPQVCWGHICVTSTDLGSKVCWGHMCDSTQGSLCPSPTHENISKYVDTVTFFSKTWTKGHQPLDDL